MSGWIKLHRQIQHHWLYTHGEPFTRYEAWIDMLMEVNHSEQKVLLGDDLVVCECGQSLNSQDTWAKRWSWNKSKVRRFLKLLESDGMITTKPNRKTTHLTICKYGTYQVERTSNESQVNHKRITSESHLTPNKKDKKEKNDKKETKDVLDSFDFPVGVLSSIEMLRVNLKGLGSKFKKSESAWNLFYNKVKKSIASHGEEKTIICINDAVEGNWKTIYEPREVRGDKTSPVNPDWMQDEFVQMQLHSDEQRRLNHANTK